MAETPAAESGTTQTIDQELDAAWAKAMGSGNSAEDTKEDAIAATSDVDHKKTTGDQPRSADGKFAEKDKAANGEIKKTDVDQNKVEAETSKDAAPDVKPPNSWPNMIREQWDKFSPEQRQWFADREKRFADKMAESGRVLKGYQPFDEVYEKHKEVFDAAKAHPAAVFNHLIGFHKGLAADPVAGIKQLAVEHGVDMTKLVIGDDPRSAIYSIAKAAGLDLVDLALADPPPMATQASNKGAPAPANSEIAELRAEVARMKAEQADALRTQQDENSKSQLLSDVNTFAQRHQDFDELSPLIVPNIQVIRQSNPELNNGEVLQLAYEQARRLVDARVSAAEAKRLSEQSQMTARSKAASAVNVRGSAANGSRPAPMSESAEIDAAWSRLGLS